LLLANAGLLDGLEATTQHGAIDLLRQVAPKTTIHSDRRFVDKGLVVCSAGIAAGIDMSLQRVRRIASTFAEVQPQSLEEWLHGFNRDQHPERDRLRAGDQLWLEQVVTDMAEDEELGD
jgi:transcriptional regulator GlxA family with amidase domain